MILPPSILYSDLWKAMLVAVPIMIAGTSFVAKLWVENTFNKRNREHQHILNLLGLKSNRLYEDRFNMLKELYQKLFRLQAALSRIVLRNDLHSNNETLEQARKKRLEVADEAYNQFQEFYLPHKIFFTKAICEHLDKIQSISIYSLINYEKDADLPFPEMEASFQVVLREIPLLMREIEDQCRKLLGVEDNS